MARRGFGPPRSGPTPPIRWAAQRKRLLTVSALCFTARRASLGRALCSCRAGGAGLPGAINAAGAPILKQALNAHPDKNVASEQALRWTGAIDLWDDQMWEGWRLDTCNSPARPAPSRSFRSPSTHSARVHVCRRAGRGRVAIDPNWGLGELIVAAFRSGKTERAADELHRLSAMTHASGTDWALGIEARSRARLSDGDTAERLYLGAIGRLRRTRIRVELARAHLLRGEWLRRERWRLDTREQLRAAHEMSPGSVPPPSQIAPHLSCWHRGARPQTHRGNPGRPDPAGGSNRAAGPRGALQTRDRRGCSSARTPSNTLHKVFVVRAGSTVKWDSLRPCGTSVAVPWSGRRPRFGGLVWAQATQPWGTPSGARTGPATRSASQASRGARLRRQPRRR